MRQSTNQICQPQRRWRLSACCQADCQRRSSAGHCGGECRVVCATTWLVECVCVCLNAIRSPKLRMIFILKDWTGKAEFLVAKFLCLMLLSFCFFLLLLFVGKNCTFTWVDFLKESSHPHPQYLLFLVCDNFSNRRQLVSQTCIPATALPSVCVDQYSLPFLYHCPHIKLEENRMSRCFCPLHLLLLLPLLSLLLPLFFLLLLSFLRLRVVFLFMLFKRTKVRPWTPIWAAHKSGSVHNHSPVKQNIAEAMANDPVSPLLPSLCR